MSTDTDLANITQHTATLDAATTPFGDVANVLGMVAELKRVLTDRQREIEAVAVEILQRDGPQIIGDTKYYAGPSKSYKCRDLARAVDAALNAAGGDLERFIGCLSSGALKPGETRKVFEEAGAADLFTTHFETVETWEMKTGKPTPKLQKINLAFVGG